MKKYIIMLFSLAGCVIANAHAPGRGMNFNLSRHNFCDTIPIEFVDDQVYIPVTIGGECHLFNLDTGLGQGMVSDSSSMGQGHSLGNVVSVNSDNTLDTVGVVSLPSFQMGSLTISDYVAVTSPKIGARERYDAIIGFDFFNQGLCAKIDAANKIMILTDRRHAFDGERGFTLKYKLKWFVPYVLVSPFKRHVDQVLFDLGDHTLYAMNQQSFMEHAYKSKNVQGQVVSKPTENKDKKDVRRQVEDDAMGSFKTDKAENFYTLTLLHLDRLRWDKFDFQDVRTATTEAGSRIGGQILRYGTITINPFRSRITFQPYNHEDSVRVDNAQPTILFTPQDDKPVVNLIFAVSDAYHNGLRQGDTVLSVDGDAINSFDDFVNYPFVHGKTYTFVVRDKDGKIKNVKMER